MIISSDPANINWSLFTQVEIIYLLLECFGVWFVIYCLHTLTYRLILKEEGKKIDLPHLFKICVTGFALNNVTPAGLVGGEPYRIMELKKYCSTEKSASSTFSFTILYALGHLLLWLIGVITYCCYGLPGSTFVDVLLLVSGGFCALAIFCILFLKYNLVYPFMRFLTKLPGIGKKIAPKVEAKKESYMEIDEHIRQFRSEGIRFYLVLFIQLCTRLLEAFEYYLIIRYFTNGLQNVIYPDGLLVMATCSLVGNLIFIIPMQAGTREGGMAIALHFLFTDAIVSQIAVPVGIVYRFREITCTFIGIIMVIATRRNKKAIAEVEAKELAMQQEESKKLVEPKQEEVIEDKKAENE